MLPSVPSAGGAREAQALDATGLSCAVGGVGGAWDDGAATSRQRPGSVLHSVGPMGQSRGSIPLLTSLFIETRLAHSTKKLLGVW